MRLLLDEQLPRQLARRLTGHWVRTVRQRGWTGVRNGELLLRAAADGFEVFVTGDRNLSYQQNLSDSSLRIIVLIGRSAKLEDLLPLVPSLLLAIGETRPGEIRQVGPAGL